ncbi:MAG: hypothetical protein COX48_02775 [bacterium (Candidatus Stahlbacteria) CG23_combo_of_CG06-09_8_20_14_all_34_7]|nr:MAG: hypothetical protein COX48_02775 [bacterium (Candidatus Stahlbacteria) CG23_combo_of_CG06-09_8_20_14_all_34_7]
MKKIISFFLIFLPLFVFSFLRDANYNVSYEVDSLRNLLIQTTVFISSQDLVFIRKNDSLFTGGYNASVTMLRKDKSPIKTFYSDSNIVFSNYQMTKRDSVIEECFEFPSDSMLSFLNIEVQDKNSSNVFNVLFETSNPVISKSGSYLYDVEFLYSHKKTYFSNDTIYAAVKSITIDSADYSINVIIQDIQKKVVYKKKFGKSASPEDTLFIYSNFYGGIYKITFELVRNKKKISTFYKSFTINFSFVHSEKEFTEMLSALSFIGKWDEVDKIRKAENKEREKIWNEFWLKQQTHPEISSNITCDEFLERYNYVNKNFSGFKKGFLTDFGRIFIMYGRPDEIERHPFDSDSKPYEIWYYWSLGYEFLFVDERGYGEYTLKNYMEQLR